ncbi:MAG TPA: DUF3014 domain-containing protein [Vicinamibacterales bacterium]|jgi:hypothetical protein|nr:DUF3014 domain-containing protein [Vicinamibacterales bacterium]
MPEAWDDQLRDRRDEPAATAARRFSLGTWIGVALLVASAAAAIYLAFGGWLTARRPATETAAPPPAAAPAPLGDPSAIALPPLDETDALVRQLVAQLSSHPRVAAWLATDNRIRNFTVVVTNIAEGKAPASQVPALRPTMGGFLVTERAGDLFINPRSYDRYTSVAEAVVSIDPAGSARLYGTLKPRIEEAYRELGEREPMFDRTLERAIVLLLSTPVPDDPIAVEPKGIGYRFANDALESLAPAQKELMRMGPQNARAIQRQLRAIALALGIPAERLPSPTGIRN